MFQTQTVKEKFILAAIEKDDDGNAAEENLKELALLVETGGGETVGRIIQKREAAHPRFYLGTGKTEELRELMLETNADGVVCDDELSPAQHRNLEKVLNASVLDRTMVILDIFAGRAVFSAGKAQVETAQLKYRLSRLSGHGIALSRLGGGIGTRGPGERKLESDRRHIRNRIAHLNEELKEIADQRDLLRQSRKYPVVSLVGYTNAGKSTLMNAITGASVLAEDKLFVTLDTVTRAAKLPNGGETLFIDTVGFIKKLPHHLIQSFKATLDELKYSDILLHVVDASNPAIEEQMSVVYNTLKDLGVLDKPIITVFNKSDKVGSEEVDVRLPNDNIARTTVGVSALTGKNIDRLLIDIEKLLQDLRKQIFLMIPYSDGRFVTMVHERGEILEEKHLEAGTYIKAYLDSETVARLSEFVMDKFFAADNL
ncbi:MAG: GTPase HflX [Clostridiales bacterium]|jgi:GTP-binding protein HflX|nr:GTPase HflX [Clostridiales bacterium]